MMRIEGQKKRAFGWVFVVPWPVELTPNAWVLNHVQLVSCLSKDIKALEVLMAAEDAPKCYIRAKASERAIYSFTDVSRWGLGCMMLLIGNWVHYRHGQWVILMEEMSLNFWELCNLVTAIEEATNKGLLMDVKVCLLTTWWQRELFLKEPPQAPKHFLSLHAEYKKLEMAGQFILHAIHVAGSWMILERWQRELSLKEDFLSSCWG